MLYIRLLIYHCWKLLIFLILFFPTLMNTKTKGYILGIVAAAVYGMNPLFTLPLYEAGMDADSVLFLRYLIAVPIVALMAKARGQRFKIQSNERLPMLLMGVMMAATSWTLFTSYNYMDAGIASSILFVYPLFVALIMMVFFKEKLKATTVICLLMAILGIGLLYKTSEGAHLSLAGTLFVLASALTYAIYIVGVNQTALKQTPTLTISFYVLALSALLFFIKLGFGQNLQLPPHWYLWFNILALSVFTTTISFVCTTLAIQYIGSTPTAILGVLEPVTAVFFGILVFDETLTFRNVCGLILIMSSVTIVVAGENISTVLVRFRKMFPKLPHKKI